MEETLLVPSPNWFRSSILAATRDRWLVYGGPNKSLCVLEPLPEEHDGIIDAEQRFTAHVIHKAHADKIVSVAISPEWPNKRCVITGSFDGVVKLWNISKPGNKLEIKNTSSHEEHSTDKEEVCEVCYSTKTIAITIGSFGRCVKWDVNTNVVKKYTNFLKNFRPTCAACSPHTPLFVAVGTKQGVIFLLDLNGNGKLLFKVRGQDEDIMQLYWCPQQEVVMKKQFAAEAIAIKRSTATQRLENIRKGLDPSEFNTNGNNQALPDDSFNEVPEEEEEVPEDDMFDIYKDHEADEFGHKKYKPEMIVVRQKTKVKHNDFLAECAKLKLDILNYNKNDSIEALVQSMDNTHVNETVNSEQKEGLMTPSDNTDTNAIVDGEHNVVSVDNTDTNRIVDSKRKVDNNDANETFDRERKKELSNTSETAVASTSVVNTTKVDGCYHKYKYLLASISKSGALKIWSKSGKVVGSCNVFGNNVGVKFVKGKTTGFLSLVWFKPDILLVTDAKSQVLETNPLIISNKNKMTWQLVSNEVHRRGLFCMVTTAPRVQTAEMLSNPNCDDDWVVWTTAQDRYLVQFSMKHRKILLKIGTCGGYLYQIRPCPYDVGKFAICVGDGAVRVWDTHTTNREETKLSLGRIIFYWQNVLGKVLCCAWHPHKENLLAFGTAESRVGLLDTSGRLEKPARVLTSGLTGGIYSLCWGDNNTLYACGGGELVMYNINKPAQGPVMLETLVEGQKWDVCAVTMGPRGMTVGSTTGGVALLASPGGRAVAAKFVFAKMIYTISWHPQQISTCDEDSKYKNLVALCSADREGNIAIIEYDGDTQFSSFTTLTGHKDCVLHVSWNPHRDEQLLSTSQDSSVRVWDVSAGACVSIFGGHTLVSLGATWLPLPQLAHKVMSAGSDYCLRLWDVGRCPPHLYDEPALLLRKRRANKKKEGKYVNVNVAEADPEVVAYKDECKVAGEMEVAAKTYKKFMMPQTNKRIKESGTVAARIALQKFMPGNNETRTIKELLTEIAPDQDNLNWLKMFGTLNELNELLDEEGKHLTGCHLYQPYVLMMIFRGEIEAAINYANERDMLDPFLLSIAPCLSFKYWRDVAQLYIAQLDRMVAKGLDWKLTEFKFYGGAHYHKAAVKLSLHDVKGALDILTEAKMHKEAYILCRIRHMDSIAKETLVKWAEHCSRNGELLQSAIIYIVLGQASQGATVLRRANLPELLGLSTEIAKAIGMSTFADFVENKQKEKELNKDEAAEETELAELPSKIEVMMKHCNIRNEVAATEEHNESGTDNGKLDSSDRNVSTEKPKEFEIFNGKRDSAIEHSRIHNQLAAVEPNGSGISNGVVNKEENVNGNEVSIAASSQHGE